MEEGVKPKEVRLRQIEKSFYISVGNRIRSLNIFSSQGLRARGRRPWAVEVAWKKVGKKLIQ